MSVFYFKGTGLKTGVVEGQVGDVVAVFILWVARMALDPDKGKFFKLGTYAVEFTP